MLRLTNVTLRNLTAIHSAGCRQCSWLVEREVRLMQYRTQVPWDHTGTYSYGHLLTLWSPWVSIRLRQFICPAEISPSARSVLERNSRASSPARLQAEFRPLGRQGHRRALLTGGSSIRDLEDFRLPKAEAHIAFLQEKMGQLYEMPPPNLPIPWGPRPPPNIVSDGTKTVRARPRPRPRQ